MTTSNLDTLRANKAQAIARVRSAEELRRGTKTHDLAGLARARDEEKASRAALVDASAAVEAAEAGERDRQQAAAEALAARATDKAAREKAATCAAVEAALAKDAADTRALVEKLAREAVDPDTSERKSVVIEQRAAAAVAANRDRHAMVVEEASARGESKPTTRPVPARLFFAAQVVAKRGKREPDRALFDEVWGTLYGAGSPYVNLEKGEAWADLVEHLLAGTFGARQGRRAEETRRAIATYDDRRWSPSRIIDTDRDGLRADREDWAAHGSPAGGYAE